MIEYTRPFSNSTEYDRWTERNCCHCALWGCCYARRTLDKASYFSGVITQALNDRIMGKDGKCKMYSSIKPIVRKKIDERQELLFKGE